MSNPFKAHWGLEPELTFLNHGSFGACPKPVLEAQTAWRERLEAEPVRFFVRELEKVWDAAREGVARFLDASPEDVVFVPNATAGVNTVLRSLRFSAGDELLTTNHEYNASKNALEFAAARDGARVTVAQVPFPLQSSAQVVEAILAAVTPRTRLALLDHVTSPTGLVFPIQELVRTLEDAGVATLVDGAHAPGMVPLSLRSLGASYYTGNFHKWVCAPKGAAFLYVRRERQPGVRPLSISHGANSPRKDRSKFQLEFDWTGTADPTPYLCVPVALGFLGAALPGGWPELMRRNHDLVVFGRRLLCERLGTPPPCPETMLGMLASVPLPDTQLPAAVAGAELDPLQNRLFHDARIEVPIVPWPAPPKRLVRISAQLYNEAEDYRRLAEAI